MKEKLSYFLVQQAMGIMHFALRSRNSYIYIYTHFSIFMENSVQNLPTTTEKVGYVVMNPH